MTLAQVKFWWHRLWHGVCDEKITRYRWAHTDAVRELDLLRAPYCPKCGRKRHECGDA